MRRARRSLSWVVTLACAVLIGGCVAGETETGGKVRIRFSGYTGNPAETDLLARLVAEFNGSQPDIEVVYEPVPGQYYPKMLTMLVANTAPDVFYLDIAYFKPFLGKKIVRPLDDYIAASAMRRHEFIHSLYDAFTHEGRVYGIPKDFNTLALFYNKELFDEANVPHPDSTWDLARLREVSWQLAHADGWRARSGFVLTHDDIDRYLPVARMFGATLFDRDE
jgi:ABC-type glycerol-3-phosphate transport system substrate-binding protein